MCNSSFKYESTNGILTFCKNLVFQKILILVLWSKNIQTNQNAGFFNLQYLTNELGYEVEFLYAIIHQQSNKLTLSFQVDMARHISVCSK